MIKLSLLPATIKPEFPAVIDNSFRSDFVRCPSKAFFRYQAHLGPKVKSVHLHAGAAMADALRAARVAFYGGNASEEEAVREATHAFTHSWGAWDPPDPKETKTYSRCLGALWDYFQEYPLGSDILQPLPTPIGPAAEFTFAVPLPFRHPESGDPLLYGGRFDMLATFGKSLIVVDEKTTGALGSSWSKQWSLDSQITGYCWGAQQHDYPVAGAVIRGIGILKESTKFAQVPSPRNAWEIERWYAQLLRDVDAALCAWDAKIWNQALDRSVCDAFSGCVYKPLCELREISPEWIASLYDVKHWNPLSKDPEESARADSNAETLTSRFQTLSRPDVAVGSLGSAPSAAPSGPRLTLITKIPTPSSQLAPTTVTSSEVA